MSLWRATFIGYAQGQTVQNTLHLVSNSVTPLPSEATAIVSRCVSAYSNFVPVLNVGYNFDAVDVVSVDDPTVGANFAGINVNGGVSGDALNVFTTARAKWITGYRGWAAKGRWSVGPLSESQAAGSYLTTTAQTAIRNAVSTCQVNLTGGSPVLAPIVLSTIVNGAPRLVPEYKTITNVTVQQVLGSQLSRKNRF